MMVTRGHENASNLTEAVRKFNPLEAFRVRGIAELDDSVPRLNMIKDRLSNELKLYLKQYRKRLDIARLCRALAIPGEIARLKRVEAACDDNREATLTYSRIRVQTKDVVGNILKQDNTTVERRDAIRDDIDEVLVYLKMYNDIELVYRDSSYSKLFPYGNTFRHVVDLLQMGGLIARYKYVSRNGSEPEEKLVSYHPLYLFYHGVMEEDNAHIYDNVLGVHIQGDEDFGMFKIWGQGDEMLRLLAPRAYTYGRDYKNTIVRWGKEQVIAKLEGREDQEEEFLY